jgi:hypothetical protein
MGFKDAGKPHYLSHRERSRKRFRDVGADALPDYELIELVLFRAVPRRDTKPLAKVILARFGTFAEAMNAPDELLKKFRGLAKRLSPNSNWSGRRLSGLSAGRCWSAAGARLLEPGARLLPRIDGIRAQGAIPHPVPRQAQSDHCR